MAISSQPALSSRQKANEAVEPVVSHALVQWIVDLKHTVVAIGNITKHLTTNAILEEDSIYRVTWSANKALDATLIAMGTSAHCNAILSIKTATIPKPILAKPLPKKNLDYDSIMLADENSVLRLKIKELQSTINDQSEETLEQKKEIEELKANNNMFAHAYNPADKDKYLQLARNTLVIFGEENGVGNGMVVLSVLYPKVFVPIMLKDDMSKSARSGGFIFRKLIQALVVDRNIWAERVGSDIQKEYPSQVGASFGGLTLNF